MSLPVKLFNAKVTDEYGGEYPLAITAIRAFSETTQTTGHTDSLEGQYSIDSSLKAITYKVSYWYSAKTKAEGKRSRPLFHEENGEFLDVFTVDLDNEKVKEAMKSSLPHNEKVLQIVTIDVTNRLA